ncbi:hypothetical protein ACIP6V_04600 [Streptomyces sp. NPDC088770]|uniref:hypothetical protein n=1 Tax=Streptomyces sp. NPDC088770 TaxID=3365895 RepID=UPI0037F37BF0
MSFGRKSHLTGTSSVPYRSAACRIGTHPVCAESSPVSAPIDVPVIYEVCDCPCHSAVDPSTPVGVAP